MKDKKREIARAFLTQKNSLKKINDLIESDSISREFIQKLIFNDVDSISDEDIDTLVDVISFDVDWKLHLDVLEYIDYSTTMKVEIPIGELVDFIEYDSSVSQYKINQYKEKIIKYQYKMLPFLCISENSCTKLRIECNPADCEIVFGKEYLLACKELIAENKMVSSTMQRCVCNAYIESGVLE